MRLRAMVVKEAFPERAMGCDSKRLHGDISMIVSKDTKVAVDSTRRQA